MQGAGGAQASNGRRGSVRKAAPERRSREAALGRGLSGENPSPSPSFPLGRDSGHIPRVARALPSLLSSPDPLPSSWRASGRRDSADFWAPEEMRMGWGRRKSGWQSPKTAKLSFPPAGLSGGPGQPQLPAALRQRVSHCNRMQGPGDCPPRLRRGRRGQAPGARAGGSSGCPARRVSPPRPRSIPAGPAPGIGRANVARECARARRPPAEAGPGGNPLGPPLGPSKSGDVRPESLQNSLAPTSLSKIKSVPGCRPPRSFLSLPILPAGRVSPLKSRSLQPNSNPAPSDWCPPVLQRFLPWKSRLRPSTGCREK